MGFGVGTSFIQLPNEVEWEKAVRGKDEWFLLWNDKDSTLERCDYDYIATMHFGLV